jgi:peptidoglycan/LPS O-acetylase OafA/YrhL
LTSERLVQWVLLVTMGVPLLVAVCYLFHVVAERPFMNTKPALKFWRQDATCKADRGQRPLRTTQGE